MDQVFQYVIPGRPASLQKTNSAYKRNCGYDSQKEQKLIARITLQEQHLSRSMFTGPISLEVVYYMPIATVTANRHKTVYHGAWHAGWVDLAGLFKMTNDILQGIVYESSGIIVSLSTRKLYDHNPRTEITIRDLSSEN